MIYPKKPLECWREVITKWRNKADDNHKYCLATILSALNSRVVDAKEVAKGYQKALQEVHKLNCKYFYCTKVDNDFAYIAQQNMPRREKGNYQALI